MGKTPGGGGDGEGVLVKSSELLLAHTVITARYFSIVSMYWLLIIYPPSGIQSLSLTCCPLHQNHSKKCAHPTDSGAFRLTRGSWRPTLWNISSLLGVAPLYSLVIRTLVVGIPCHRRTIFEHAIPANRTCAKHSPVIASPPLRYNVCNCFLGLPGDYEVQCRSRRGIVPNE